MSDDTIIDAREFGLLKASNINAGLATIQAGATLEVPGRQIVCDEPINLTRSNVTLALNGATLTKDFSGAPLVSLKSPYGASNVQQTGMGLLGGYLDGGGVDDGYAVLELDSVSRARVDVDVTGAMGAGNSAVIARYGVEGVDLANSPSIQDSQITLRIRQTATAAQRLAHCFRGIGSINANPSCNRGGNYIDVTAHHHTGRAMWLDSADRNNITLRSWKHGGTGAALWCGAPKTGLPVGVEGNIFDVSADGVIYAEGTSDGGLAGITNVITPNYLNGTPTPTFGAGSRWIELGEYGDFVGAALVKGVLSDSRFTAFIQRALMTTETARIFNGSDNHIRLVNWVKEWIVRLSGDDFIVQPATAGGRLRLPCDVNLGGLELEVEGEVVKAYAPSLMLETGDWLHSESGERLALE